MRDLTPVVKQLLIINILFFVGSQLVPVSYEFFSLFYPESIKFKFWQPITHLFMHAPIYEDNFKNIGNISHIVFNMFALHSFGTTLEKFWGGKKFLFFYFSCGLGAFLVHSLVSYYYFQEGLNYLLANDFFKPEVLQLLDKEMIDTRWQEVMSKSEFSNFTSAYLGKGVGASGAIYGLLVAFAFIFPNVELALMFIPVPIKAKYFVPIWLVLYDGFFGIFGSSFVGLNLGIGHFAHIGGALTGFLMMWSWKKSQFEKNRWD